MDLNTFRATLKSTLSDGELSAALPFYLKARAAAQCTTIKRAAAFDSQLGHESSGLRYMAEIQTNGPGWTDDRRIYRGRGPIQLTWSGNYRKFGLWCMDQGYVDDSEIFVKNPALVEQYEWGFLAASWYWLYGGPRPGQINGYADAGDIVAVSRCVNGWVESMLPNGMPDRQNRWDNSLSLGDRLLDGDVGGTVTFSGDPTFLEDVLKPALGDRLKVEPDWKERGTGGTMGDFWGIIVHHTANRNESVDTIANGRADLSGPLAQILIDYDGTVHLVAVGPCNHAGVGTYPGLGTNTGNNRAIGIECAYPTMGPGGSFDPHEKWPDAMIISLRDTCAAILKHVNLPAKGHMCGHKDYANKPPNIKIDPSNLDVVGWLAGEVQKDIDGFVFPGEGAVTPTPVTPPPAPSQVAPPANADVIAYYAACGYWDMLGGRTQTEALAIILDRVLETNNAGKPGVSLTRPVQK